MVRDLNELLRERIGGGEPGRRREFLAKHGAFFPGAQTLDDIIDQLAAADGRDAVAAALDDARSSAPSSSR